MAHLLPRFVCDRPRVSASPSGLVSMISLAVLSYERYCTMMSPNVADGREYRPVLGGICFSWLYSVAWTVPPLLGWSRYGPEGPGTTCSVDWKSQTPNNISYVVCLFTFCLVLPFCVILYSYGKLLYTIRQVRRCGSKRGTRGNIMRALLWDGLKEDRFEIRKQRESILTRASSAHQQPHAPLSRDTRSTG